MLVFPGSKLPYEDRTDGAMNGLKVVELEPEAMASELEGRLEPQAASAEPPVEGESSQPVPPQADHLEPLKEDPTPAAQSDPHLTPQDMRRARRIRV